MAKILLTSHELLYQWNEDVTDEVGFSPNGDRTYIRKVAPMEPFPGVRPDDILNEYLNYLNNHAIRVIVNSPHDIGMNTIGFENESFKACLSIAKFEELMRHFLLPMMTNKDVIIIDKDRLRSVIYESLFREKDRKIRDEIKKIIDRMNKYVSVV